MDLYNVNITAIYETPSEGEVDVSYSELVYANSEKEAIDFVEKDLLISVNHHRIAKAESAYKIDFEKVKRKRTAGYYIK